MNPSFSADTYGVKTLKPGESKVVPGKTPKQAYNAVFQLYRRHPAFRHREFEWSACDGGVLVKRVK